MRARTIDNLLFESNRKTRVRNNEIREEHLYSKFTDTRLFHSYSTIAVVQPFREVIFFPDRGDDIPIPGNFSLKSRRLKNLSGIIFIQSFGLVITSLPLSKPGRRFIKLNKPITRIKALAILR